MFWQLPLYASCIQRHIIPLHARPAVAYRTNMPIDDEAKSADSTMSRATTKRPMRAPGKRLRIEQLERTHPTIRDLYPNMSEDELRRAEANLRHYLAVVVRMWRAQNKNVAH